MTACDKPSEQNSHKFSGLFSGPDFSFTETEFSIRKVEARTIIRELGHTPTLDFRLVEITNPGTRSYDDDEIVDLKAQTPKSFIVGKSDRTWTFAINEIAYELPFRSISEAHLRQISNISDDETLFLERKDQADRQLNATDMVVLDDPDVERIYARPRFWKLKVQDILLTISTPTIVVKDALVQAGIDPTTGWTAAIKYKDAPREAIALDGVIDLTRKGIEKLWLRPDHIQNGEDSSPSSRAFALREEDENYLSKSDLKIETMLEGGRRWAILREVPLPQGYTVNTADIAIEVPPTYPAAQLDMFYCYPHLVRTTGGTIPQTQSSQSIEGKSYQRWSRHREGATAWNPASDSLITHIAIITDAVAKEVGQ